MRFYTTQHPFYCGIDLHARPMSVCILSPDGEVVLHRNRKAAPEPFLTAIAPYRDGLVVAVECLFTWYWLADLCAQAGLPFVLGHALDMKALHGGTAKNDKIDAQTIAVLLRGGMLPPASVYPAAMRATRDLLRRRWPLTRKRPSSSHMSSILTASTTCPRLGRDWPTRRIETAWQPGSLRPPGRRVWRAISPGLTSMTSDSTMSH